MRTKDSLRRLPCEGGNETPAAVLWTRDPDNYIHAIAQRVTQGACTPVPILTRDSTELKGFGSLRAAPITGPVVIPAPASSNSQIFEFLKQLEPRGAGEALCVTVSDPFCLAVAALLCLGRCKRFVFLPTGAITPDWIASLLQRHAPRSITFVCPALLGPQTSPLPQAVLLRSLVRALRKCDDEIVLPPFGIVTGVDKPALTQVAAKSVLWRPIAEYYADGEVCFVDEDAPPSGQRKRRNPAGILRNPAALSGVNYQPLSTFLHKRVPRFAQTKRRLLVVKVHGRSYCAGKGLLCTARQITMKPEQPIASCVGNFDCVGPEFLQFDPRRFNARIMVVDACDSIGLHTDYWQSGNSAVTFLTAAGHPSAVIAGDGMVVPLRANGFELLATVVGCTTMGEWSRQLSATVRGPNPPLSFILFGDPDLAIAVDPTPWVVDAAVKQTKKSRGATHSWRLSIPKGPAAFARARLGSDPPEGTNLLYAWSETQSCDVEESVWVSGRNAQTAWFAVRSIYGGPISIRVERRSPIGFSSEAIKAVRQALTSSPDYLDPTLKEGWTTVELAGEHLLKIGPGPLHTNERTVRQNPDKAMKARADAEVLWEAAQAACLSTMVNKILVLSNVYLPAALWQIDMDTVRTTAECCPLCGAAGLLARDYRSGASGMRSCYDCPSCCFIIEDKPLDVPSVLSRIDAPQAVAPKRPVKVRIWLTNPYEDRHLGGVLHVSVNWTGHRLRPDHPMLRFRVPPRSTRKVTVRLLPTGEPTIPHAYAIRALALANGFWHWRAHRLAIAAPQLQRDQDLAKAVAWCPDIRAVRNEKVPGSGVKPRRHR